MGKNPTCEINIEERSITKPNHQGLFGNMASSIFSKSSELSSSAQLK